MFRFLHPIIGTWLLVPLMACGTTLADAPSAQDDLTVQSLDRLLQTRQRVGDPATCFAENPIPEGYCARRRGAPMPLTVALDPRYRRWPNWQDRLNGTLRCVNTLYRPSGLSFRIAAVVPWDPGAHRHSLYPLLHRLRREVQPKSPSLRVGITVWEPQQIHRMSGGEIGLSQAGSCVVPSWPRVENDCVILAHELGHLVGARHLPGKHWVMGWSAHPFHLPATDPLQRVTQTYRFHPRNIRGIELYASGTLTAAGLAPHPSCGAALAELDRCLGGGS